MPKRMPSRPKISAHVRYHDHRLTTVSLATFGLSEAEIQKLTPFAALMLRTILETMHLQEEKRLPVRDALSSLLESMRQSANLQELAMAILNAENCFPKEIRADMLQLTSRLHRFA